MRPFLTLSGMMMTGNSLLTYMKETDEAYSKYLDGVQPEVVEIYRTIVVTVEDIAHKHYGNRIPSEFASQLRGILCHYFRDLHDFHLQGMSGTNNIDLKHGYERVLQRVKDISEAMSSKGA